MEPVRPMSQPTVNQTVQHGSRFSFSSPQGKKESVPVISDYYPKRIVYPYAKIDRRIDNRLVQAATVAQERAHAHSRSRCWHYVKDALLASGVIDSRPKTDLARDAASELVNNYGFKRLSITDPFAAPVGSVSCMGLREALVMLKFAPRTVSSATSVTDAIASPSDGRLRNFSPFWGRQQLVLMVSFPEQVTPAAGKDTKW